MPQKRKQTIDDIAKALDVSKTTVSRAISGKGRISDTTRKNILKYIEQCNYRPSAAAKGLAESKTYNLALVMPRSFLQLDMPHYRQSMNSICEEAFIFDYNILICLSTDNYPESLMRTLDGRKVDGVILSRTVEHDGLIDILTDREIPFATIGALPTEDHGKAVVEADHDHVGACGVFCRNILHDFTGKVGLLGNDLRYMVNKNRLSGFQKAVSDLQFPQERVMVRSNIKNRALCATAVSELLEQGVTRLIAMDDDICVETLQILQELGRLVPQDIRVYSLFDGPRLEGTSVSALRFDAVELGHTVCRELLRYLRDEVYSPQPILGYRIIQRG